MPTSYKMPDSDYAYNSSVPLKIVQGAMHRTDLQ
jgi:hypothetical protein